MRIRFDEYDQGREAAAIDIHRERTDRLQIPPAPVLRDPVPRDISTEVLRGTAAGDAVWLSGVAFG